MTAATITELSVEEFPCDLGYGTKAKRARVFFRSAIAGGSTVNLATYVPGCADVEGLVYETDNDTVSGTASTWSTTTVTVATGVGLTTYEACYAITFT